MLLNKHSLVILHRESLLVLDEKALYFFVLNIISPELQTAEKRSDIIGANIIYKKGAIPHPSPYLHLHHLNR